LRIGYARRMTRLAPILLTLLAFAAASCDGDDAPSQAPSQEDFAEQANKICRDAKQSLESVAEGADGPEDIVEAIDEVIEESRNTVDQLADLERPEGDAGETAEQFVDATRTEIQEKGIPGLEELRGAVESEDQEAIQEAATRLQGIDSSASNRTARALGATECAEGQ
jgi:nucleotide-binding universal stress UspA family protein